MKSLLLTLIIIGVMVGVTVHTSLTIINKHMTTENIRYETR